MIWLVFRNIAIRDDGDATLIIYFLIVVLHVSSTDTVRTVLYWQQTKYGTVINRLIREDHRHSFVARDLATKNKSTLAGSIKGSIQNPKIMFKGMVAMHWYA